MKMQTSNSLRYMARSKTASNHDVVIVLVWFASDCSWMTPFRFRNRSGSARGTFQPCSLLAVVSNMSFVTVLVMVYLPVRLDSNQWVYRDLTLQGLDSNLLVLISLLC
jgi:hypothetical protein